MVGIGGILRASACHLLGPALIAASAGSAQAAAQAGPASSAYTRFDTRQCRHERGTEEEDYGSWACRGFRGSDILLSAGDQRMYVTFGRGTKDDLALSQTFTGFNHVYEGTVEWRLHGGRPIATILRWSVMKGNDLRDGPSRASGRVLVVTRLGPGGTCHVGYVDAQLNADANVLARQIADAIAPGFRCGVDKRVVRGATSPDLALPVD